MRALIAMLVATFIPWFAPTPTSSPSPSQAPVYPFRCAGPPQPVIFEELHPKADVTLRIFCDTHICVVRIAPHWHGEIVAMSSWNSEDFERNYFFSVNVDRFGDRVPVATLDIDGTLSARAYALAVSPAEVSVRISYVHGYGSASIRCGYPLSRQDAVDLEPLL